MLFRSGVVEDNSFGTHEFMELCDQLGCKKYINGNVGSGTVQEMSEWIEYMTFDGVSPMADLRAKNGHPESWTVDYFGAGNENWGCGGNMTQQHYGNLYRQFQTYVRNYKKDAPISKICCGANVADYFWTRGVLETTHDHAQFAHGFMDGLSLHYYTHPEGWEVKGSSTDFDEEVWYKTLNKTLYMEELINRHGAIMDEFDPEKKIGMIVDEWGTWFTCEPGTNPGFLYQQSTMRDALVAGINLNIFNKHCDRVKMANIAQMVNVLQAVILTEGEKMILTPTYHVFNMYKYHQDAQLLDSYIETKEIGMNEWKVPNIHESVSLGEDGKIHITMNNLSIAEEYPIEAFLNDTNIKSITAELLTSEMHAHNTFDAPNAVTPCKFETFEIIQNTIHFVLPACSVMHIAVEI